MSNTIEKCRNDFVKHKTLSISYMQRKYKISFKEAYRIKNLILGEKNEQEIL
jgi:hypothetical protein